MRRLGKWFGRGLLGLVVALGALWAFGPREDATLDFSFDPASFGDDLDAYFATQEARFDNITPGVEKRVIWAGSAGAVTPVSLVYLHGFSATSEEIRPVPDRLAKALGANLIYTRLAGHGQPGTALAAARVATWAQDTAEAIRAGQTVGQEVIVMSTSTGGTLAAAATSDPGLVERVKGMIFVSPNFGLNSPVEPLLTLPAARYWLPALAGRDYSYEPVSEANATFWTTAYPSVALLPMAALVKKVAAMEFGSVTIPALFWFSPDDQVVRPEVTNRIAADWGQAVSPGLAVTGSPTLTSEDDDSAHVIAGDILSPQQTEPTVAAMLAWIEGLD